VTREAGTWLRRRAENIAAAMLAVMFAAFIIQIVFRYFFNFPTGWTTELTVICWLWLVLWGSAFVLGEKDEIRFDLIYSAVRPRVRIGMAIVCALVVIGLYGASLKASYDTSMKGEKASYPKIRRTGCTRSTSCSWWRLSCATSGCCRGCCAARTLRPAPIRPR
jgi:TRAP-type C4-dicarboxylate transport system permease small subunit